MHHHAKYPAGKIWVEFRGDFVNVKQPDGTLKRHNRYWFLPFLAKVWMGQGFSSTQAADFLRRNCGLVGNHWYCNKVLRWALLKHYDEVKDYLAKTQKFAMDKICERINKNITVVEEIRDTTDGSVKTGERLEAASIAGRELGRIYTVEAEVDKKEDTDAKNTDFQERLLSAIREEQNGN